MNLLVAFEIERSIRNLRVLFPFKTKRLHKLTELQPLTLLFVYFPFSCVIPQIQDCYKNRVSKLHIFF